VSLIFFNSNLKQRYRVNHETYFIYQNATDLTKEEMKNIRYASPMHDIGKIGIPDSILLKPGKLTSREFDIIKKERGNHFDPALVDIFIDHIDDIVAVKNSAGAIENLSITDFQWSEKDSQNGVDTTIPAPS